MPAIRLPRRAAVDTGALLALASSRDQYHARASRTLDQLQKAGTRLIGHVLVLGELHGHMLRRLEPLDAQRIVVGLMRDPAFEWIDVNTDLVGRALSNWIERFRDQRFSLTNALTFEVMREERVTHAFAFDQDFITAGFSLLA
jgi:predicted nucleic acid-binding protein